MKKPIICLLLLFLALPVFAQDVPPEDDSVPTPRAETSSAKEPPKPSASDAVKPETSEPTKSVDATKPGGKKTVTNVLDFEGDVIEGERKTPNLFLQLQVDTPNLDVLLYQRKDFNDFHDLERYRRPIYRKVAQ